MITVLLIISVLANLGLLVTILKQTKSRNDEQETRDLKAREEAEKKQEDYIEGLLQNIHDQDVHIEVQAKEIASLKETIKRLEDSMTKGAKLEEGLKSVGDALSPNGLGKGIGMLVRNIKAIGPTIGNGFKEGYNQGLLENK
jgi:hypothetical protein